MNRQALRFSGGRKLDDNQMKKLKKLGGLGPKKDKYGRTTSTTQILHDGKKNQIVNFVPRGEKKKQKTTNQKEHQEFMESLMEYEKSGRHPNVKPTESKRAGKRLKSYVDGGRLLQGVDV